MRTRILTILAVAALAAPGFAQADGHGDTLTAPYELGPQGGDSSNTFIVDQETGEMTVIRHQVLGANFSLGCGGSGGFSNFKVTYEASSPISTVTVAYSDALIDPYTFFNVGVRQGNGYLGTTVVRGIVAGEGSVEVAIEEPATGTLTVWFGIQVTSACPNIDGGTAVFDSVTFS